jgi:hypothetical protein
VIEIVRSRKYMKHVRERGCCCRSFAGERCGGDMRAHHHGRRGGGGMGIKTTDLHTVPLCRAHHDEFHANGEIYPFDKAATELLFQEAMVDSLALALQLGLKL